MEQNRISNPLPLLRRRPQAVAEVRGSVDYPTIRGWVRFYQTRQGVLVAAEVMGLPVPAQNCHSPIFGFHIHEGEQCTGNAKDRFADAKMHFNPDECPHPYHAGDLPPLFGQPRLRVDGGADRPFHPERGARTDGNHSFDRSTFHQSAVWQLEQKWRVG